MDQVTQQNAALVEEAAAAANALQDQSARLAELVSIFKLDGTTQRNVRHAAARVQVAVKPAVAKLSTPVKSAKQDSEWETF